MTAAKVMGYLRKSNLRKFYCNTIGKSFKLGMFPCQPSKRNYSHQYQCMWTTSNWYARQKTKKKTWKILMKDVDPGEPTPFLDHVYLGLHSKRVSNQQRYCGELQRYVRILDFCWSQGKTTYQSFSETWCRNNIFLGLMTWKVAQRNVWKDIANLRVKQISTIRQNRNIMHGWPSIKKGRKWVVRRIVCSLLTNCSEMSLVASYWETC